MRNFTKKLKDIELLEGGDKSQLKPEQEEKSKDFL